MKTAAAALDRDTLLVSIVEGEVFFADDEPGFAPDYSNDFHPDDNRVEWYGVLDTDVAAEAGSWRLSCADDPAYGTAGVCVQAVHRKTKIAGMAQLPWNDELDDYEYETPLAHSLYLVLPSALVEGARYTLRTSLFGGAQWTISLDSFSSISEALHVNLHGASPAQGTIHCDLYHWMGEGGARDYAGFEGAAVWLVEEPADSSATEASRTRAGSLCAGAREAPAPAEYFSRNFIASSDWVADIPAPAKPGRYRIAIEGIGTSQPFTVAAGRWKEPFATSVRGFYYMRLGEAIRPDIIPEPRQPRYIPGVDPVSCRILRTSMHPWHPEWKTFAPGDKWDPPAYWAPFVKPGSEPNMLATGGHSDAYDWDRHLGHVSIIYDMLLPFYILRGRPACDDTGIAESGNGIPDLLDEARNEVDFWLALRDGEGYSHGVTNPDKDGTMYQADSTSCAAWASAANAAMLASCLALAGKGELAAFYTAAALEAWDVASRYPEEELDRFQHTGVNGMLFRDFRMTAAAYLWDRTGEERFERIVRETALVSAGIEEICVKGRDQVWATAGYLFSQREPTDAAFAARLRAVAIAAGCAQAAAVADDPARRSSDRELLYFHTGQNVDRIIIAHALGAAADAGLVELLDTLLLEALLLEADWGMGRNPLNMIQMTTAYTPLAAYRSVENAYTTGRRDGRPGLHPGHTPYYNTNDWGRQIMARPSWIASKGWPPLEAWPRGEACFNTRWSWSHTEFTPQQTMRGKMALYAYLWGLGL